MKKVGKPNQFRRGRKGAWGKGEAINKKGGAAWANSSHRLRR